MKCVAFWVHKLFACHQSLAKGKFSKQPSHCPSECSGRRYTRGFTLNSAVTGRVPNNQTKDAALCEGPAVSLDVRTSHSRATLQVQRSNPIPSPSAR